MIVEVAIVTFSRTRHTVEWSCSLLPGCQCCSLHPATFHACNHYQNTYIQLLCSGSVKGLQLDILESEVGAFQDAA